MLRCLSHHIYFPCDLLLDQSFCALSSHARNQTDHLHVNEGPPWLYELPQGTGPREPWKLLQSYILTSVRIIKHHVKYLSESEAWLNLYYLGVFHRQFLCLSFLRPSSDLVPELMKGVQDAYSHEGVGRCLLGLRYLHTCSDEGIP